MLSEKSDFMEHKSVIKWSKLSLWLPTPIKAIYRKKKKNTGVYEDFFYIHKCEVALDITWPGRVFSG